MAPVSDEAGLHNSSRRTIKVRRSGQILVLERAHIVKFDSVICTLVVHSYPPRLVARRVRVVYVVSSGIWVERLIAATNDATICRAASSDGNRTALIDAEIACAIIAIGGELAVLTVRVYRSLSQCFRSSKYAAGQYDR